MIYLQMFLTYFQIGLFSFGGGYAAMPLIQSLVVNDRGWLSMSEYTDLVTIAEMTPGPIAVNSATFVGQKIAGLSGAIVCTLGCITPSLILVLLLAWAYTKYRNLKAVKTILSELRPAVVAMIAGAGLTILLMAFFGTSRLSEIQIGSFRPIELMIFILALVLLRLKKAGPIQVIFSSAIIGTVLYLIV
jgi:chromate transporter